MLSSQAQVAKACRQYMKSINVKASCTSESFAGGTAVDVEYNDQSPTMHKQITTELSQYQVGSFDGMTDSYNYTNSRDDIPQTKYMHINNRFTDELKQKAWDCIRANYAEAKNLTATYSYEALNLERIAGGMHVDQFMFRFLNGSIDTELSEQFWASQFWAVKPPKPAKAKAKATTTEAPESITVSEGTREGFVEIRFPAKPSNDARNEMKRAGFRWSPTNTCWWGKAEKLPQVYA